MTENLEDKLESIADAIKEGMEGTIIIDEFGGRWIFRNGRWQGLCRLEPLKSDLHD